MRTVRRPAKKDVKKMSSVVGKKHRPAGEWSETEVVLDVEREVQEHREDRRRQREGKRR